MKYKNIWVDISIAGLCVVGFLGLLLRSKILFSITLINYNHLIEAHSRFTFSGWVTLILMFLLTNEILPESLKKKKVYDWLLGSIAITSWIILITFFLEGYNALSIIISTIFILLTYIFGYFFIKDVCKISLPASIRWLAVSSIVCLILSSSGPFIISYIYFSKDFEAILYRDALFTYLHFQYNGFFSLAILALLLNSIDRNISYSSKKNIKSFSIVVIVSLLPSLFLSYLWQDPNNVFRIIAIVGSILILISFGLFIKLIISLREIYIAEKRVIRFLVTISMCSFGLKLLLQCFTVFPLLGNAIFGNRPIIMGFLHLVFLGFVTLFILAFFAKKEMLIYSNRLTRFALLTFAIGVLLNEILLISQGLILMFIPGSILFPWLLWAVAIWLFSGTILIAVARVQTRLMR